MPSVRHKFFSSVSLFVQTHKESRWALFVLGGLQTLALAPMFVVPIMCVTLFGLWQAIKDVTLRTACVRSFWFFAGYFFFGLYWISHSLLVDPERFWPVFPFSFVGLPVLLAIMQASILSLIAFVPSTKLLAKWCAFVGLIVMGEVVRGTLLTGFPWNTMGMSLMVHPMTAQLASVGGQYVLSVVVVVMTTLPILSAVIGRRRVVVMMVMLTLLVCVFGAWRLAHHTTINSDTRLRIVQPNIAQQDKWQADLRAQHFLTLEALSIGAQRGHIDWLIWPESALDQPMDAQPQLYKRLQQLAPQSGGLISGLPRRDMRTGNIYNSMQAMTADGHVVAQFDKFHLVPFGEYVPVPSWLGLEQVVRGWGEFTAGVGPQTIVARNLPAVSPLICYEVIFPGRVTRQDQRPQWLLNLTNDGWYGHTSGPYQHFQHTRLRAIEEGLPMVRAANTGISAVIDPVGRVLHALPLEVRGVIDANLPRPLQQPTLFAQWRQGLVAVLLMLLLAPGVWAMVNQQIRKA